MPSNQSVFKSVEQLPEDPIMSLPIAFRADPRPGKVNLGIGAYRDSEGLPEVLVSVQKAEAIIQERHLNKEYLPIEGDPVYIAESLKLIFGANCPRIASGDIFGAQAVGGTGALRVGGEFLSQQLNKTIFVSDPTWPNHHITFKRAGFDVQSFPYYDGSTYQLNMPAIRTAIAAMPRGSIILLQASCHNPTGLDPTIEQWKEISALVKKQGLFPLFDLAYQGFGQSLDEDVRGIRLFLEDEHEMCVASSYSKNFGLYGERAGFLAIVTKDREACGKVASQIKQIIRGNYSNPPLHTARIVTTILTSPELRADWIEDLDNMRTRIVEMRDALAAELMVKANHIDFSFLKKQKGIFSLCGLNKDQVQQLRTESGIYMPANGRINVAGLSTHNLEYVAGALASALTQQSTR